jgi:ketosteroid isomerase-like protein
VYRAIIRLQMRRVYARLSEGEWMAPVEQMAPDAHHVFPGDGAMGGERHSRDSIERWFGRLHRLFPSIRFEVQKVLVTGWPWDTWVAVSSQAHVTPAAGEPYVNPMCQIFQIRWGRVTFMREYVASHLVAEALRTMAASGVEEAAADPIMN